MPIRPESSIARHPKSRFLEKMNSTTKHKMNTKIKGRSGLFFLVALALAACSGQGVAETPLLLPSATFRPVATSAIILPASTSSLITAIPTVGLAEGGTSDPGGSQSTPTAAGSLLPTVDLTVPAATSDDTADWHSLPVVPTISDAVRQIYQLGLKMHNNPRVFSKVGDCETSSGFFLNDFDLGNKAYDLGSFQDLQPAIDYFAGSFGRTSLAAGAGYTASSVLTVVMADPKQCEPGEIPLACEYRHNHPSFVLVMFGTNDAVNSRASFELYMRKIIDYSIRDGIVPVLATKADNLEGDNSINALIARLAAEYDLPLWNFWAAVHSLPDHGLQADGVHLTYFPTHFDDAQAWNYAFPLRNLTALQVLNAIWKGVTQ